MIESTIALLEIVVLLVVAVNTDIYHAAIAAVVFLLIHRRDVLLHAFPARYDFRNRLPSVILLTFVIWFLIVSFVFTMRLINVATPDFSTFADRVKGDPMALAFMLIWLWTVVAFAEEIVGRVFLIERLETLLMNFPQANLLAVTGSAILFGLAHAYQGTAGIVLAAAIGFILGLVYLKQEKVIWVNIMVHGSVDTIALILSFLGVRVD